jgi:hypothetical protein
MNGCTHVKFSRKQFLSILRHVTCNTVSPAKQEQKKEKENILSKAGSF